MPVKILKRKLMIGFMILMPLVKIRITKIINPYLSKKNLIGDPSFKKESKNLDPSSGGMGTRLKTPKLIFTITIIVKAKIIKEF